MLFSERKLYGNICNPKALLNMLLTSLIASSPVFLAVLCQVFTVAMAAVTMVFTISACLAARKNSILTYPQSSRFLTTGNASRKSS